MKCVLLAVSALLVLSSLTSVPPVQAQVVAAPTLINFQGRLAKPDGTPVADGTYSVRFSLWDVASGGTAANEKWVQTVSSLNVKNGTFTTLLNVGTILGLFNGNLWLEIRIGTDAALTPRRQLVSVPFALKANTVPDGSIGTVQIANESVTSAKIAPNAVTNTDLASDPLSLNKVSGSALYSSGGNIGLGISSPGFPLNFSNVVGDKISLFGISGAHYGFGVQNLLLQIHSDVVGSDIAFGYGSSASFTERMRIRGNGNVGIGTSNPTASLDINGGLNIRGSNQIEFGSDVAGKELNAGTISYQRFTPDALEIVGAGTTGTNRKITMYSEGGLNVTGRVFLPSGVLQNGTTAVTGTTDLGLYSQITNKWIRFVTTNGDIRFFTDGGNGNSAKMMIYGDGRIGLNRAPYVGTNVSIGDTGLDYSLVSDGKMLAQSYATISDGRYKKNIAVYADALETVMRLRGVTYDWRKDEFPDRHFKSGKQIGFIAQEVEQIVPELVFTDSTGYKSVNYVQLVPVLTEALKAQQKQIDDLKSLRAENAALRTELDAIKAVIAELKAQRK